MRTYPNVLAGLCLSILLANLCGCGLLQFAPLAYFLLPEDEEDEIIPPFDAIPPAEVTAFTATPNGTTMDLSWANPVDADFAGVMVRQNTGAAPATISDGVLVYDGTQTTASDSGLTEGTTYYYRAFTYDTIPNYSTGAVTQAQIDNTPPGPVTSFFAVPNGGGAQLSWVDPVDSDYAGVMVRRSTTGYPATTSDGILVYTGNVSPQDDLSLAADYIYYYTAFAYDEVPNYSTGAEACTDLSDSTCTAFGWIGLGLTGWNTTSQNGGGSGQSDFNNPRGVFVTSGGVIYVADMWNNRISQWNDSSGSSVGWIGGTFTGWQTGSGTTGGSDIQQFDHPYGVAMDSSGNFYIADFDNDRVSKWNSSTGTCLGYLGTGTDGWPTSGATGGATYRYFQGPSSVAVDSSGVIYVADTGNHRIARFNSSGTAQGWIGGGADTWQTGNTTSSGTDMRSFNTPSGVCVDSSGNLYVADCVNHRVSKWTTSGNAVGWLGDGSDGWKTGSATGVAGTGSTAFDRPHGVAVTTRGYIYVADTYNDRVSKWNVLGTNRGWIGGASDGWQTGTAPASANDYQSFNLVWSLHATNSGILYMVDGNGRISKWTD